MRICKRVSVRLLTGFFKRIQKIIISKSEILKKKQQKKRIINMSLFALNYEILLTLIKEFCKLS